jgi:AraC family transcriptional regulator of adaptative response / DNA-3-methyladenine glycosylase II
VRLAYRAPYDWAEMIGFLAARAIPGVEAVSPDRYARTLAVGGAVGQVIVRPASGDALQAEIRLTRLDALPSVIARVRRVFDLSADPVLIGEQLAKDPALAPLVAARPGLRAPGAWEGFELAVRAILGQQVTVGQARALAARLAEAFGEPLDDPASASAGLTRLFPHPEVLASERPDGGDIAAIGMPRARAAAIQGLARAALADPALFSPRADLDAAIAALTALPGVGEWTAQYIALRALREPDAFPHGDVALARALPGATVGRRANPAELLGRAEAWRPWRAYAAQHLWAADAARLRSREDASP